MILAHIAAAILASWRITELFTQDRITDRLRQRFPTYLWQCPRCMSVWAGACCTLIFALGLRWPLVAFLNWPFALAWLYLVQLDWMIGRRIAQKGREFTVRVNGSQWKIERNELQQQELVEVLGLMTRPPAPAQTQPVNGKESPTSR